MSPDSTHPMPAVLSMADAARYCGLGRSLFAELTARGDVPSFKIGARRLYRVAALDDWLEVLERQQAA